MSDPAPPKPSPLAWFFTSRKGLLTLFVFAVAMLFALAITVKVVRGSMTAEAGFAFVSVVLLGWFGVAFKTIDAISREDVAEKSLPPPNT